MEDAPPLTSTESFTDDLVTLHLSPHNPDLSQFFIAWICLPGLEYTACRAALDEQYRMPDDPPPDDGNRYTLGHVNGFCIVVAAIADPTGQRISWPGTQAMLRRFQEVRLVLLVGVGGCVPARPFEETSHMSSRCNEPNFFSTNYRCKHPSCGLFGQQSYYRSNSGPQIGDVLIGCTGPGSGGVLDLTCHHQSLESEKHIRRVCRTSSAPSLPDWLFSMLEEEPYYPSPSSSSLEPSSRPETNFQRTLSSIYIRHLRLAASLTQPELTPSAWGIGISFRERESNYKHLTREAQTHYGLIGSLKGPVYMTKQRDALAAPYDLLGLEYSAIDLADKLPVLLFRGVAHQNDADSVRENSRNTSLAAVAAAGRARSFLQYTKGHRLHDRLKSLCPLTGFGRGSDTYFPRHPDDVFDAALTLQRRLRTASSDLPAYILDLAGYWPRTVTIASCSSDFETELSLPPWLKPPHRMRCPPIVRQFLVTPPVHGRKRLPVRKVEIEAWARERGTRYPITEKFTWTAAILRQADMAAARKVSSASTFRFPIVWSGHRYDTEPEEAETKTPPFNDNGIPMIDNGLMRQQVNLARCRCERFKGQWLIPMTGFQGLSVRPSTEPQHEVLDVRDIDGMHLPKPPTTSVYNSSSSTDIDAVAQRTVEDAVVQEYPTRSFPDNVGFAHPALFSNGPSNGSASSSNNPWSGLLGHGQSSGSPIFSLPGGSLGPGNFFKRNRLSEEQLRHTRHVRSMGNGDALVVYLAPPSAHIENRKRHAPHAEILATARVVVYTAVLRQSSYQPV